MGLWGVVDGVYARGVDIAMLKESAICFAEVALLVYVGGVAFVYPIVVNAVPRLVAQVLLAPMGE